MLFDPDRIEVDRGQVLLAVLDSEHPSVQPGLETFHRSRPRGVVAIEGVVALEEALDRRGMRAAGLVHDGHDLGLREEDSIRIAQDRKSTRLNSSHLVISYAVFCLKKK